MLGSKAGHQRLRTTPGGRLEVANRERDGPSGRSGQAGVLARAGDIDIDEVHRRAADEACNETVDRGLIEGLWRADLQEKPFIHDRDAGPHRHRLDLVVGDVDDGRLESLVETRDLRTRLNAQLGIEVRERLVHEEDGRFTDDGASKRDTLALAAGEFLGLAIEQILELDRLCRFLHPPLDLRLGHLPQLEAERQVLTNRHVRVQGVALEDHRDIAILGRHIVDHPVTDPQRA